MAEGSPPKTSSCLSPTSGWTNPFEKTSVFLMLLDQIQKKPWLFWNYKIPKTLEFSKMCVCVSEIHKWPNLSLFINDTPIYVS